jgi:polysaccharide biosynthesis/export protein
MLQIDCVEATQRGLLISLEGAIMRYIAVLLTATLSLSCAAHAGGIWGEPAEVAPIQTTGSSNDPLVGQANVTRPPAASSSKTKGLASDGSTPRQNTVGGTTPRPAAVAPAAFATPSADSAYTIGPLDTLDISVFQVPDLTKTVQVSSSGTINLPLVGEIVVAGRTAPQVERDLTSRLGAKYLQNPQVTVYVQDYNSQRVTVDGAVSRPGVYSIKGETSLSQVIAESGGFNDVSDSTVLVIRQSNGKRSSAKFDVAAIRKGETQDPTLQAGDRIVAGTSAIKTVFNTVLQARPIASTVEGAVPTPAPLAR